MPRPSRIVPAVLFSASPFLDGFLTVAAGFIIAAFLADGRIGSGDAALFAGSFMVGTLAGSGLIGRLADRFGRLPFAKTIIPAVLPVSLAAMCVPQFGLLCLVMFVLGLLVGADQPVSQALAAEKSPEKKRERVLSVLMFAWFAGALSAVAVCRLIFMLALPDACFFAVPALVSLLSIAPRLRLTESDAWRRAAETAPPSRGFPAVLRRRPRQFLFCCGFWICQTLPVTAVMFYAPTFLARMTGSPDQTLQIALLYLFFLLGVLPMTLKVFHPVLSRILRGTFVVMAVGLAGVAFAASSPVLLGVFLVLYAFAYGMQTALDYIYPVVLFPPSLRASSTGIILAVSRGASALCAMGFPFLLERFEMPTLLLSGTVISLAGMLWLQLLPAEERAR